MQQKNKLYTVILGSILCSGMTHASQSQKNNSNNAPMIVTASKQSPYSASSTNVSATIVDNTQLQDAGVTTISELTRVLPGLTIEQSGNLLFPVIALRGISSAQDFYHPAISIYVDGVPLLATDMLQTIDNIQSVEMLRGPQGTLYGQSAQGGIINIITQKPGHETTAFVEGGYGSRESHRGKIHLSTPLKDGLLYGSLTLAKQDDKGDFINPATGSDDLGGADHELGDLKLRLAPDDQPWEVNLAISDRCTEATQDSYIDFNHPDSDTFNLSAGSPDPYLKRCTHSQSVAGRYDTENWRFNIVTAFRQQDYRRTFPNGSINVAMPESWDQNVQEIRAATQGKNRTIDVVFGLYRQYTKEKLNLSYDLFNGMNYQTTDSQTTSQTIAAYTDLTWHVTEQFNIGGGLRFSHDRAETNYAIRQMGTGYQASNSQDNNKVLGQISAGYQLTPAWRVYSRIAQGYKPAGFNIIPAVSASAAPYDEETSLNYEAGTHYQTGNLQLQSAIFHSRTKDMQLYSGPAGAQTLSNAGTAEATGLELSSGWQFTPGWTWDISATAVHSEFTDGSELYAGNKVPLVARFSGSTSISGLIDTSAGVLTPRLGVRVVGPHYFDGDNALRQSSYAITDLRLGWQATDKLTLSAYANNLFDRTYRTYAFSSGASAFTQVNMGRTIGLDARYDLF